MITYLKLFMNQMLRQKFYTSVSLFGISFTIFIASIGVWMIDMLIGSNPPAVNRYKCLYVEEIFLKSKGEKDIRLSPSYLFMNQYVKSLKTVEKVSIYRQSFLPTIIGKEVHVFSMQYTDVAYWEVNKFEFIEGRPYNTKEFENGDKVVVITEDVRDNIFGKSKTVVGKFIETKGAQYEIIGVVKNIIIGVELGFTNIWIPISALNNQLEKVEVDIYEKTLAYNNKDGFKAIILAKKRKDFEKIKTEYQNAISKIKPTDFNEKYDTIKAEILSVKEVLNKENDIPMVKITVLFLFLFMILPIINLMNLNYNQFIERYEEIGIRKSFGASSRCIVSQLVMESFFLTILGGLIGYLFITLFSDNIIDFLNLYKNGIKLSHGQFHTNWRIILYLLGVILFFSFCSSILPAWKLSKLTINETLNGGKL
jgi:putative ABC transport system permease protein